jgi:hypothetical protein
MAREALAEAGRTFGPEESTAHASRATAAALVSIAESLAKIANEGVRRDSSPVPLRRSRGSVDSN